MIVVKFNCFSILWFVLWYGVDIGVWNVNGISVWDIVVFVGLLYLVVVDFLGFMKFVLGFFV